MLFIRDRKSNSIKNIFELVEDNVLNIYVCGPTLYRKPHIGNFRSVIFTNYIINLMKFFNVRTNVYSSITDIGQCTDNYGMGVDKIINVSNKLLTNYYDLVHEYFIYYVEMLNLLKINSSINYIAASSLLHEYSEHVNLGISKDLLYSDENYNIRIKKDFIDKNINELIFNGSRLKEFVIWKHDESGISEYNGNVGNPGWHMECFCIINKYFQYNRKFKVDIHIGGVDLLDIHNNAEIIHSKIVDNNYCLSKFWLSVGLITKDGFKLSKSKNNIIYVDDFMKDYNPSILKIIMFNTNIESDIDINENAIKNAKDIYYSVIDKISNLIYKNFYNPNINFDSIILFIKDKAMSINLKIENFDSRTIINKIININNLEDLYYAFLYDFLLSTQIFDSLIIRQKEARKLLYLQQKRIEFKKQKLYKQADSLRDKIVNFGLKLIEGDRGFFIY